MTPRLRLVTAEDAPARRQVAVTVRPSTAQMLAMVARDQGVTIEEAAQRALDAWAMMALEFAPLAGGAR